MNNKKQVRIWLPENQYRFVPDGTRFCYLSTIARSGTWFSFYLFEHYVAYLYKEKPPAHSHIFNYYPMFSLAKIHIHTTCPGFRDVCKGQLVEKWNTLNVATGFDSDYELAQMNIDHVSPHHNPDARIIHLYRNPLDQVVSLYNHAKGHKKQSNFIKSFSGVGDFLRRVGIDSYLKQYLTFHEMKKRYPDNVMLVEYEALKDNTAQTFQEMLAFLEMDRIENSDVAVSYAVEHSSAKSIKKMEAKQGHSLANDQNASGESHIRSGKRGEWKHYLSNDDVQYVEERMAEFDIALRDFSI